MGCSNSREFEIEDATLNPKMLEEDALARIHADVAEKFGALLAVDAEVDGIDRRGSTGVHGHFEWTCFAPRPDATRRPEETSETSVFFAPREHRETQRGWEEETSARSTASSS